LLSSDGCYINGEKYGGPWEGETSDKVELHFNRNKLRQQNVTCRATLDEYISSDLGTSRYRGFQKDDHITVILDLNYYSYDERQMPKDLYEAENCCVLFDCLWEMADLKSGATAFFLLDEPLEMPNFTFGKSLIRSLKTDYRNFIQFFSESNGEKRACLKGQLMKFLQKEMPVNRLQILFERFDEIFQNTSLSYDRICVMNGEDKLAMQLEKESLDILERSKSVLESLKAEILVLATNAIGFGYLDFSDPFSMKNFLIVTILILINIVFSIVLCNGLGSLKRLKDVVRERSEALVASNPLTHKKKIQKKSQEFFRHLKRATIQFYVCIALLWLPLIILAFIFPSIMEQQTQELVKLTFELYQ